MVGSPVGHIHSCRGRVRSEFVRAVAAFKIGPGCPAPATVNFHSAHDDPRALLGQRPGQVDCSQGVGVAGCRRGQVRKREARGGFWQRQRGHRHGLGVGGAVVGSDADAERVGRASGQAGHRARGGIGAERRHRGPRAGGLPLHLKRADRHPGGLGGKRPREIDRRRAGVRGRQIARREGRWRRFVHRHAGATVRPQDVVGGRCHPHGHRAVRLDGAVGLRRHRVGGAGSAGGDRHRLGAFLRRRHVIAARRL